MYGPEIAELGFLVVALGPQPLEPLTLLWLPYHLGLIQPSRQSWGAWRGAALARLVKCPGRNDLDSCVNDFPGQHSWICKSNCGGYRN